MQRFNTSRFRFTLLLAALLAGALVACDNRTLPQQNADGGPSTDSVGPSPDSARPPDSGLRGSCQTDVDCPSNAVCGCVPDPNCPMCDVCFPGCVPIGLCDPKADPALVVTIGRKNGELRVRLRNASCQPIYRLVGCCGEGQPSIEQAGKDSWEPASCLPPKADGCCAAEPRCEPLAGGAELELPVAEFGSCGECRGTFRATFTYFIDPGCGMLHVNPLLTAQSNAFDVAQPRCQP